MAAQGKATGRLEHLRDDRVVLSAVITLDSNGTAGTVTYGHGVKSVTQSSTGIFYLTLDDVWNGAEGVFIAGGTAGTAAAPGFARKGKVDLASKKIWFFTGTAAAPQTLAAVPNMLVEFMMIARNTELNR